MREFIGKHCKLQIKVNERFLYYTADIKDVTNTHIYFIDKFGDSCSYKIDCVVQIREVKDNDSCLQT